MRSSAAGLLFTFLVVTVPSPTSAQHASCAAAAGTLTPANWRAPIPVAAEGALDGALSVVQDIALPGPANRFDYQSLDLAARRLYLSHMNAGRLVVVDLATAKVLSEVGGVPRATGVLAVPAHHAIYVSSAGRHDVAIVDDQTLAVTARVAGVRFPDGLAYASDVQKVFVSDESGEAEMVIDARTRARRSTISLGGEAGNTHYDSVSRCILVAVQTRNQLVAIDPGTEAIVARYDLPGSDHPHGFILDEPGRLAFVSSEESATLQVVDLRTMRVIGTHRVGDGPDVLAWDPAWRRLYVASEGGILNVFAADGRTLRALHEYRAPHAHTVSVDPTTHHVFLALENVSGRPLLRVLSPSAAR